MQEKVTTATAQITQATPAVAEVPVSTGFVTFHAFGENITVYPMVFVLIIVALLSFFYLYRAQQKHDNDFDAFDLIMDEVPVIPTEIKTTRKASLIKIFCSIAFGVATWVIINQEIRGVLGIETFGPYLTVVLGVLLGKLLWDKPFDPATILAMFNSKGKETD
jgi:drug/metabolite transporter (DMT)-like permease